jgi:hypothetical protein
MNFEEYMQTNMVEGGEHSLEEAMKFWRQVDGDKSGYLSLEELYRSEGPPEDMKAKLRWYWDHFVADESYGMTFNEFVHANMVENS